MVNFIIGLANIGELFTGMSYLALAFKSLGILFVLKESRIGQGEGF